MLSLGRTVRYTAGSDDFGSCVRRCRETVGSVEPGRRTASDGTRGRGSGDRCFHVGNPEGTHALMHLPNDRGTPASLRNINAHSGHTYKFAKEVETYEWNVFVMTKPQKYFTDPSTMVPDIAPICGELNDVFL
ncbi:hypothetical protein Trco_006783 [Trichoderma cornu-damae]|uniref:Catalase core domain-containing protein n=1 Tax=Trichoderma cornu-damae TaxID=654480 RepID=A0A9P8TRZ5_9HYPO|nr:hypothetical protein Trco_006783 [Trichoderma cornu-damae]